jgi:hypothetical protein
MYEIIKTEGVDPKELFSEENIAQGLNAVLEHVDSFQHDMSTKAGRARTASLSYRIGVMSKKVDDIGKDQVSEQKKELKAFDARRKSFRDGFKFIKEKARKPLTDLENEEKAREAEINDKVNYITSICNSESSIIVPSLGELEEGLQELVNMNLSEWPDIVADANRQAVGNLEKRISREKSRLEKEDADEKLRIEAEKKERELREAELEKKAAADAKAKAERAAKDKINKEKLAKEKAIRDKEIAERKVGEEKRRSEARAALARKEERDKIEREKKAAAAKEAARVADKAHREKIISEAFESMKAYICDDDNFDDQAPSESDLSKILVGAIASGKIKHVFIKF